MKGVGHVPRETPLPGSGCHAGGRGGTRPKGVPLYLEVGAMQVKGVGHVPRETSLPGSGCHEDERGGTRPKGDPSTWKWVP
jgi:hypothetical protein